MTLKKKQMICAGLLFLSSCFALAADEFLVKHIEVDGLQRIPRQTVLDYLPIHEGQMLAPSDTSAIISSLYQTGFFSDVSLSRKGDTLIIQVVERGTISLIKISGNKAIKKDDLMTALKQSGISEGETYNQATLQGMKQALLEQYYSLGRYSATVDVQVVPQPRSRVELDITIHEGDIAKVREINIIGNHAFSTHKLLKNFKLAPTHWWNFLSKSDEYSSDKLEKDLESLRSYYYDRGYLKFTIDSSQVTITPNKKDVYITIHVTEGPVYRVQGYNITGNLLGLESDLRKRIHIKPNEVFSRKKMLAISDAITRYYADRGYATANVQVKPTLDDARQLVFITFEVTPGNRMYVRQINYFGNTKTADYVLRRETRQMEGALYSASNLDQTMRRLNNLGYVENIEVQTEPVPGKSDLVDLKYTLKESSSTNASAQVGFSDTYGLLYGANITQKNFRGTGKSVSVGFNNSQYVQTYSFNYFDPYYTTSGISRGFSLYFQQTTPGDTNLASYTLGAYGAMMNYRLPLSEYDFVNFGYGYEYLSLNVGDMPSEQIENFVKAHGTRFNNAKLTLGWTHNDYDRAIMPTKGFGQYLGGEAGVPLLPQSLDYYKVNYDGTYYHPIIRGWIVELNGNLGYGNGYDGYSTLPFFKNFYAGGIGTVRGFEGNTLGPRDSHNNPLGGNILLTGSFNVIVPNPISDRLRTSVFVDVGNVYDNHMSDLSARSSTGVEVDWVSPLGPLKFSLARPLHSTDTDELQVFQFSVGTSF